MTTSKDCKEIRFLDPRAVPPPEGVEGWERMYSPAYLFTPVAEDAERAKRESDRLWIWDSLHQPPIPWPMSTDLYDTVWWPRLNQMNTNVFCLPPAAGLDHKMLYGYPYLSSTPITDPALIQERAGLFNKRAGHYFQNWEEMLDNLRKKSLANSQAMAAISFEELPNVVDEADVLSYKGTYCFGEMESKWRRIIDLWGQGFDYHFEAFNLAHAAHLSFADFCKSKFPNITESMITTFGMGVGSDIFRPDEILQELARLALSLGLVGEILKPGGFAELRVRLGTSVSGKNWLSVLDEKKDPWFAFTTGYSIVTPMDRSWSENMDIPLGLLREYVVRLGRGEVIEQDRASMTAESDRIAAEYRDYLAEADKAQFDHLRALDRTTSPHIEGHMFWFECLHNLQIRRVLDELGKVFVSCGLMAEAGEIWYLRICEVEELIKDYVRFKTTDPYSDRAPSAWYWTKELKWRAATCQKLAKWQPPNALGIAPAEIQDPFYIGLWGITTERVGIWHKAETTRPEDVFEMKGVAASPGVAEGKARVLTDVTKIDQVQQGDILVCRTTSPSWCQIFGKTKAIVADVGGMMSHSAIVSREYSIPAVTGTGNSTAVIRTGDLLRVDGDRGLVTIVQRA